MSQIIILDTNLLYDYIDLKEVGNSYTSNLNEIEFLNFMESSEHMKGFHIASLYELFGRIYKQECCTDSSKAFYRTKRRFIKIKKNLETNEYNIKFLSDNYFQNEMNSKLNDVQYCINNMKKKISFEKKELTRVLLFLISYYSDYYLNKEDGVLIDIFQIFLGKMVVHLTESVSDLIDKFYLGNVSKKGFSKKLSKILGAQIDFVDFVFDNRLVYPSDQLQSNLFKILGYVFKTEVDGIKKIQSTLGEGIPKSTADKRVNIFLKSMKSAALNYGKKGFNSLEMSYFQYLFESIQSSGRKIDKNDAIDFVISTSFETGKIKKMNNGFFKTYMATFITSDKFLRNFVKEHGKYNEEIHKLIFL